MSINQNRFSSIPANFNRKAVRLSAITLLVMSAAFVATTAMAASAASDANALYRAERAACNSGKSHQDRATCLREAGAALQEAKRGRLNGEQTDYRQNALTRCIALPAADRDACQRRIEGEGTISGSVPEGGVLRELVVPDTMPATAPGTMPGNVPGNVPDTVPGSVPGSVPGTMPDTMPDTEPDTK